MNVKPFSEENIIEGIAENNREILTFVYKTYYPPIKWTIMKNTKFSADDTWDIFQDAMVLLFKKIKYEKMHFSCTVQTFLISLCNKLMMQRLDMLNARREDLSENIAEYKEESESPDEAEVSLEFALLKETKYGLIYKHFKKLKKDCKKILTLFFDKTSMKEIAKKMGFSSENYAKKRKHLCMAFLIEKIKQDKQFNKIQKNRNNENTYI